MNNKVPTKNLLMAILSGSYTPHDLREFVKLCYDLAVPLVRKKILVRKLNLTILRMSERDALFDCLADLFERDEQGTVVQVKEFFEREAIEVKHCSEEFLLDALRRIVFHRVNLSLVRIHSELDPILGKILHNIDVTLERTNILSKITRFGESYLIPLNDDPLLWQSPMPVEYVRERFSRVVVLHDTMPAMLKKIHHILAEQNEFQRAIAFVSTGILFKEIYKLSERIELAVNAGEDDVEAAALQRTVEKICREMHEKFYPQYVGKKKTTEELFAQYLGVVKRILSDGIADGIKGFSLFDSLKQEMPTITKQEYQKLHRSILEYLYKEAKKRLQKELSA